MSWFTNRFLILFQQLLAMHLVEHVFCSLTSSINNLNETSNIALILYHFCRSSKLNLRINFLSINSRFPWRHLPSHIEWLWTQICYFLLSEYFNLFMYWVLNYSNYFMNFLCLKNLHLESKKSHVPLKWINE